MSGTHTKISPFFIPFDMSPESYGLTTTQINALKYPEKVDLSTPKIIFMHHPAINCENDKSEWWWWGVEDPVPPNMPGGNDGCIANNRWNFIDYAYHNNVQLVLTGHTHEAHVFDATGLELVYKAGDNSYSGPLFIQTPSATIDNENFKHGYRIIDIKDGI